MKSLLNVKNLEYTFHSAKKDFPAVRNITFSMEQGECLGLLGESGCGKTTTARIISGLLTPDSGQIFMNEENITKKKPKDRKIQMVFQNPTESFDPRFPLLESMQEGISRLSEEKIDSVLRAVSLDRKIVQRYPRQVSGGQCQRAAIARALLHDPLLLIMDEAVSDLDVITQSEILALIHHLKADSHLSILFICHDPAIVQDLCDHVCIMKDGQIIESGSTETVFSHPVMNYTKQLLDAAF